jgi:hypothetical protein
MRRATDGLRPLLLAHMLALGAPLALGTGCMRVDVVSAQVRDPGKVGVVADKTNTWLLLPDGVPQTVTVYRGFALTATVSRSESGAITYTSEHWALGTRRDTTPLTGEPGRIGWLSMPGAWRPVGDALQGEREVRLHPVHQVVETGPFGMCNGPRQGGCTADPAVPMSLATDSANIREIDVVRTPIRTLGIAEVIAGGLVESFGLVAGAFLLPDPPSSTRNAVLGVDLGVLVLGGLTIGNGLWRLLVPEQRFVLRPD